MTETTNQISYFERRFVSLETAVVKAAEGSGVHDPQELGSQFIAPEILIQRMADRIKELQDAAEPAAPKLKFSPTIEHVIENTVRRFLIPHIMDGVTGYRVYQEKIVQIDLRNVEIAVFPIGHLALKNTFTEDEWKHLKSLIRQKVTAHYDAKGLRDANPEDEHNL